MMGWGDWGIGGSGYRVLGARYWVLGYVFYFFISAMDFSLIQSKEHHRQYARQHDQFYDRAEAMEIGGGMGFE